MNDPQLSDQQKLEQPPAPGANEDLTIAEQLRGWDRKAGDHGDEIFSDGETEVVRLGSGLAEKFLEKYGAMHPGDYRAEHGHDWRDGFAALAG